MELFFYDMEEVYGLIGGKKKGSKEFRNSPSFHGKKLDAILNFMWVSILNFHGALPRKKGLAGKPLNYNEKISIIYK